jgi:hypothetical protein
VERIHRHDKSLADNLGAQPRASCSTSREAAYSNGYHRCLRLESARGSANEARAASALTSTWGSIVQLSIPDDVFAEADRLAKQLNMSRSQLYSRASKEFLARHAPDQVTDAMHRVCDDTARADDCVRRAARRGVEKIEW